MNGSPNQTPRYEMRVDQIKIPLGRRPTDPAKVTSLAASMKALGLLQAIVVDVCGNLIAGAHRLAAAKELGWEKIPVTSLDLNANGSDEEKLRAELAMLDENLERTALIVLDEMEALARRKKIHEELHPEKKAGQSQAAGSNRAQGKGKDVNANLSPTFAEDSAAKTGQSPRSIQRKIATWKKLDPEAVALIRGNLEVADNMSELIALANLPPDIQREIAARIKAGEIGSVREALSPPEPESPEEKLDEEESGQEPDGEEPAENLDDEEPKDEPADEELGDGLGELPHEQPPADKPLAGHLPADDSPPEKPTEPTLGPRIDLADVGREVPGVDPSGPPAGDEIPPSPAPQKRDHPDQENQKACNLLRELRSALNARGLYEKHKKALDRIRSDLDRDRRKIFKPGPPVDAETDEYQAEQGEKAAAAPAAADTPDLAAAETNEGKPVETAEDAPSENASAPSEVVTANSPASSKSGEGVKKWDFQQHG